VWAYSRRQVYTGVVRARRLRANIDLNLILNVRFKRNKSFVILIMPAKVKVEYWVARPYQRRHGAINLVWRISPNVDDVVYWAIWAFLQLGGRPGRSEDIPLYPTLNLYSFFPA
jgi:hypothetical protein